MDKCQNVSLWPLINGYNENTYLGRVYSIRNHTLDLLSPAPGRWVTAIFQDHTVAGDWLAAE